MRLLRETALRKKSDPPTVKMLDLWSSLSNKMIGTSVEVLAGSRREHPRFRSFEGQMHTALPQMIQGRLVLVLWLDSLGDVDFVIVTHEIGHWVIKLQGFRGCNCLLALWVNQVNGNGLHVNEADYVRDAIRRARQTRDALEILRKGRLEKEGVSMTQGVKELVEETGLPAEAGDDLIQVIDRLYSFASATHPISKKGETVDIAVFEKEDAVFVLTCVESIISMIAKKLKRVA